MDARRFVVNIVLLRKSPWILMGLMALMGPIRSSSAYAADGANPLAACQPGWAICVQAVWKADALQTEQIRIRGVPFRARPFGQSGMFVINPGNRAFWAEFSEKRPFFIGMIGEHYFDNESMTLFGELRLSTDLKLKMKQAGELKKGCGSGSGTRYKLEIRGHRRKMKFTSIVGRGDEPGSPFQLCEPVESGNQK